MHVLKEALTNFLQEDIGKGDITSEILPDINVKGKIISKERAVIAGLEEARRLFQLVNCKATKKVVEGFVVKPNTVVMTVSGKAKDVLAAERTALNILMRMSGIATETRRYLEEARRINPNVKIASTRKTSPGFRLFDKRAVKVGGGETHRMRLDGAVLIKDNHLAIVKSIEKAVKEARRTQKGKIEVEVGNISQAVEAIQAGASIIMLDNLTPENVRAVVKALKKKGLRDKVVIEVSGGVNHRNIRRFLATDIDMISIGSLTHSSRAVDMSLEIL